MTDDIMNNFENARDELLYNLHKNKQILEECKNLYTDKELDKPYSHRNWFAAMTGVTWRSALDWMAKNTDFHDKPDIRIKNLTNAEALQIFVGTHTIEDFTEVSISNGGKIYTLYHDVDSQYLSQGHYAYYLERKAYWYAEEPQEGDIKFSCNNIKFIFTDVGWRLHPDEENKHPYNLLPFS